MEIAIRRRPCEKSHLHRFKAERSSLPELEHEQPKLSLSSPRFIRLHESAITEALLKQQRRPPFPPSRRLVLFSDVSTGSPKSSAASSHRLEEASEEQLDRALADAEEIALDAAQPDDLDTDLAAFSAASMNFRAGVSSSVLLGGSSDVKRDLTSLRANVFRTRSSAPAVTRVAVAVGASDDFNSTRRHECQICFDRMDEAQAHTCAACRDSFCTNCTRWYIEFKIVEGEVSQKKLVCLAPHCTHPLSEELIESLVSPDTFTKYKKFLKNQKVGIRFCPRAGCCAVLDEPLHSTARRVKCSVCKHESCMRCGGDFHKLLTCRRVDKRLKHWKRHHDVRACPNCKAVIEKQGGCSHMKCVQCDQEFCWSCLCSWKTHHESMCLPLTFLRSKSPKLGCWAPMRVVTKTAVVGVSAVAAVAGAGLAIVVLPPVFGCRYVKGLYRRHKYARGTYFH